MREKCFLEAIEAMFKFVGEATVEGEAGAENLETNLARTTFERGTIDDDTIRGRVTKDGAPNIGLDGGGPTRPRKEIEPDLEHRSEHGGGGGE